MRNRPRRLFGDEEGATVVEYAVILALIIAGIIVVIQVLGGQVEQGFADFKEAFEAAKNGP
jgi:Flp pilus assembly pilin Flp